MDQQKKTKIDLSVFAPKQNLSWPNLISVIRLMLIPLILWLYFSGYLWWAVGVVLISALTDAVDGYIARNFNQITPLGKILDPFADKLTQVALAICIVNQFPVLIPLVIILVVKELFMLRWGIRLLRADQPPFCALWWGKLSTTVFYLGAIIIMLFAKSLGAPGVVIITMIIIFLMLNSMLRYWHVFREKINNANQKA